MPSADFEVATGPATSVGGIVAPFPGLLVGFAVGFGVGAAASSKFQVFDALATVTDTPSTYDVVGGTPVPIATVRPSNSASGYCALKSAYVHGSLMMQKFPV